MSQTGRCGRHPVLWRFGFPRPQTISKDSAGFLSLCTGRPVSYGYDLNGREGPRASWPVEVPSGP